MLDKMRRPTRGKTFKKYFYLVLFALIIATFVFMGSGSFGPIGGAIGGVAASVNGENITLQEYNRVYDSQRRNLLSRAKGLPDSMRQMYLNGLEQRVLDQLVQRKLAQQLAEENGVTVSDSEVVSYISKLEVFQEDGRFQKSKYRQLLQANGLTSASFEQDSRGSIATARLNEIFGASLKATDVESKLETEANDLKLSVDFIKLSRDRMQSLAKVNQGEITEFVATKADEVKKYYDGNKTEFTSLEKTSARHILIKTKSQSDADYKAALDKINGIKKGLTSDNFADLAKKHSEDKGSAVKGGSLGEFDKNVSFVPPFKKAALSLEVGKISEPIKTRFGYHVIEVTGKKPGGTKTLKEVEKEIAKKLIAKSKVDKDMEGFKGLKSDSIPGFVDKLKGKYNLKWANTGDFTLGATSIPSLGTGDKVWSTVLGLKASKIEMVETDGSYLFVKSAPVKNTETKKTDAKKTDPEQVISRLSSQRANGAFQSWMEQQSKKANISKNTKLFN